MSARLPIDELGDLFGLDLDDEDVDSAGGLLTKELGRLPQPGRAATVSGLHPHGRAHRGPPQAHLARSSSKRDQALIDAQAAFDIEPVEEGTSRG